MKNGIMKISFVTLVMGIYVLATGCASNAYYIEKDQVHKMAEDFKHSNESVVLAKTNKGKEVAVKLYAHDELEVQTKGDVKVGDSNWLAAQELNSIEHEISQLTFYHRNRGAPFLGVGIPTVVVSALFLLAGNENKGEDCRDLCNALPILYSAGGITVGAIFTVIGAIFYDGNREQPIGQVLSNQNLSMSLQPTFRKDTAGGTLMLRF